MAGEKFVCSMNPSYDHCHGTVYALMFDDGNVILAWTDCEGLIDEVGYALEDAGIPEPESAGFWKGYVHDSHEDEGGFTVVGPWERIPAPWEQGAS